MTLPGLRDWLASLTGALLSASIYCAYVMLRLHLPPAELAQYWDQLLAVAVLAGGGIFTSLWVIRYHHRNEIRKTRDVLIQYQNNPSTYASSIPRDTVNRADEWRQFHESLENLCAGYRKALTDRVIQNEALENMRNLVGQVDLDKGILPGQPFRGNTTSRDMVARLTPNLCWLTATPRLQEYLGFSMSDLNGKPFSRILHSEDVTYFRDSFKQALQTGEAHNVSFRLRIRPAGDNRSDDDSLHGPVTEKIWEDRHVQAHMLTRYNELGAPLHVRCYVVDISDRVWAEQELLQSTRELSSANDRLRRINQDLQRLKESYRDLYHNAPVMYFSLDGQGNLVTFNDTLLSVLGYSREDLIRKPYTRLLTDAGKQRYLQDPGDFHQAGETETLWVKKNGVVIDIWIRNTPIQDGQGNFVRSRSVAQDVTDRMHLSDELRRRGDELERANKELRQINSALDDFTAVVSHDLKEPLRTMEAYSSFLSRECADELGEQGKSYIQHLKQASRRLGNLIDDLLALAQAGRIIRSPKSFDLAESVKTACNDLDDLIQRRNASVVIEGGLPFIVGDSQRVIQLFSNLIANGLKYNLSSSPVVTIAERASENTRPALNGNAKNGKKEIKLATICITDDGTGIDPDSQEDIFGIFRRGSTSGSYEGTGAGLAIAKKIVESHGGRIWVESQVGVGSTFCVTLPRSDHPVASLQSKTIVAQSRGLAAASRKKPESFSTLSVPANTASAADYSMGAQSDWSHERAKSASRILLVEDMKEIALIVQRLAKKAKHRLKWVASAEAAWDYLQEQAAKQKPLPDLLLLDIHLPGMSGVDFCKQVRDTPELAQLRIALFSQLEHAEARTAGRSAGANYVLSKSLLCQANSWQKKVQQMLSHGNS